MERELKSQFEALGLSPEEALKKAKAEALGGAWSFELLQEDYRILSTLEEFAGVETEEKPGGYSPGWSVRVELAISIMREERYKVRREFEYQDKLKRDAERRARKGK